MSQKLKTIAIDQSFSNHWPLLKYFTLQICLKLYFRQNSRFLSYMSASGPLSHWRALSALSSWLVYKRKLGVSGMYWAVIKSMTGAPAQTSASWRQSNLAPIAKADKRPICDATLVAEHRLPRMEGWAISLMYNWDVNWKIRTDFFYRRVSNVLFVIELRNYIFRKIWQNVIFVAK